eukprot:830934-Rhodomonas_salina.1
MRGAGGTGRSSMVAIPPLVVRRLRFSASGGVRRMGGMAKFSSPRDSNLGLHDAAHGMIPTASAHVQMAATNRRISTLGPAMDSHFGARLAAGKAGV